jgi:hypothetical protein
LPGRLRARLHGFADCNQRLVETSGRHSASVVT